MRKKNIPIEMSIYDNNNNNIDDRQTDSTTYGKKERKKRIKMNLISFLNFKKKKFKIHTNSRHMISANKYRRK